MGDSTNLSKRLRGGPQTERDRRIRAIFREGLRGVGYGRHSAEVTSDRLADALDRWPDSFDGEERDMIGRIRHCLQEIADGNPSE